ncbi:DUF3413 domain-containing protein [Shewanella sp.]|nr:DUF3413 domain-containing protein [Shewanella sp.]
MVERQKQLGRDRVSRLVSWGHWFAFYNGLLAIIIGYRYLDTVGFPDSWIGWGYLALNTIGHFSFLAFMVYLVLIFPVTLLLPYSKVLRGYAAVVATFSLCLLLYDTIIYNDYGLHLSPFVFELAWTDLSSLLQGTSYIVTPLGILAIELTLANYLWKRIEKIRKRHVGNKVVGFIGVCFIASHLIHIWGDAADVTDITQFDDAYPLSYPATARSFIKNYGIQHIHDHKSQAQPKKTLNYPLSIMQCKAQNKPNILVIAIDSLQAQWLDQPTMPFLTGFSNRNQSFQRHISGGNQFNSGMFSLLYGLQGSYQNAIDLHYESPVLTQELSKNGYQLGLFTTDNSHAQPQAIFNDFQRIDTLYQNSYANADLDTIKHWQQWTESSTQPWFSLVNLKAPSSYDTPAGFLGISPTHRDLNKLPAEKVLLAQYRQSLNFIDGQLEKMLTQLPENTLVVITGISGKVFTTNPESARVNFSSDNVHVPMIIAWPTAAIATQVNYQTTHNELVPTLMTQALKCTNPAADYSAGNSLLQPSDRSWVYIGDDRAFAIYQPNEITTIDRHGNYQIYDINYHKSPRKKINAPELIEVMREGRRFYIH